MEIRMQKQWEKQWETQRETHGKSMENPWIMKTEKRKCFRGTPRGPQKNIVCATPSLIAS